MTLIDKAEVLMLENEFSKIYIRVYQGEQIIRTDRAVELSQSITALISYLVLRKQNMHKFCFD